MRTQAESIRKDKVNQQERSKSTQIKLLQAALDCISDYGYRGATMDKVVARAGVSRGAQMHHFPTKHKLVEAAFDYMLTSFIEDLREHTEIIRNKSEKPSELLKYLWVTYFSKQLFSVTKELVVESRTNEHLKERLIPITEQFRSRIDDSWYLLNRNSNVDDKKLVLILNLSLSLLRGMGFETVLWNKPDYFEELLNEWLDIVSVYIE